MKVLDNGDRTAILKESTHDQWQDLAKEQWQDLARDKQSTPPNDVPYAGTEILPQALEMAAAAAVFIAGVALNARYGPAVKTAAGEAYASLRNAASLNLSKVKPHLSNLGKVLPDEIPTWEAFSKLWRNIGPTKP